MTGLADTSPLMISKFKKIPTRYYKFALVVLVVTGNLFVLFGIQLMPLFYLSAGFLLIRLLIDIPSFCKEFHLVNCKKRWNISFPQAYLLAKQMSVNIRENKGIGTVPRLNDAMVRYSDKKNGGYILIGEPLIDRLSESSLTGVLAHELAHLKKSHSAQIFILVLLIGMFGLPPYFIFFSSATYHVALITVASFMALALSRLSWNHEYEADLIASQYVEHSTMISTLQQLEGIIKRPRDTFTHPSYTKRVERLRVRK